ncbi:tRNA uridine-5-carboxymethylaminomethyl(34) synthesis GTPase MnmE [Mesorhizobium sp. NBSH29]|uniref:tRNA uridine-5-carboxymethylaminomethyl(34) synthesis GTPase MnmE n=1 Tax=Mesorhizobium sp. NBSH29 TaxID=2654249 RepID=UPI00189667F2|nr:tRNA uridine-5-carboxymethylaminomethyl(34) synthesis GTPase MnmE [Mesorhizobium sp. NBSH29]QPC86072.1 tRNA uridine-5-carboxymethylaminomethyl(34) synthesis GTPase MnmE [Mesorhizobium sp. NBSH29]
MPEQTIFSDSIFALSSGRLPSGVAVIRLSGSHTRDAMVALIGGVPEPRKMKVALISDTAGLPIDRGLAVFFRGPFSFTGEDCAEIHVHGGRAVVAACLAALGNIVGFRQAEAGEFTRRAFLNGKVDLTASEGLADLVDADTEAQRRFAISNASGAQKTLYEGWRSRVIAARALIEAELDFSDQEDVPGSISGSAFADIEALAVEIRHHIAGYRRAEIVREGFKVVIVGAPNAGKSSLLNALARRDVAIVSEEAGTTRDLVEVSLDLSGVKVTLVDTAGIRDATNRVEQIGIERARAAAVAADLVIELRNLDVVDAPILYDTAPGIVVGSKSDVGTHKLDSVDFNVSSISGHGIEKLLAEIEVRAVSAIGALGDILPSRMRHVELLSITASLLEDSYSSGDIPLELRAEDLRGASLSLGRIVGSIDVEDLLDAIFSSFCVGK